MTPSLSFLGMTSKVPVNSQFLGQISYLKIEGGGGQRQITEKWHLKIQTVEDIDVKLTQKYLAGNKDRK